MKFTARFVIAAVLVSPTALLAAAPTGPISLPIAADAAPESVYAPPVAPTENAGVNEGAVHFSLGVSYLTDNVFRGIERFEYNADFALPAATPPTSPVKEDFANVQVNGRLSFDLGRFPSPFAELFINTAENVEDGDQSFQELRPTVGFDWNLRPFKITVGHTNYIFPEDDLDANGVPESAEVFGRLEVDDAYFLGTEKPVLSPHVFVAYDYDEFNGTYIELGGQHAFALEDLPLTLTLDAHIAYVSGLAELYGDSGGLQHYQLGLTGEYSLNSLFNFSTRYGDWTFRGYLNYTGKIDDDLRSDDQLWGGAGIGFRY